MLHLIVNGNEGDANVPDSSGWTPLHHACKYGHEDTVTSLINLGGNVN